MTLPGTRLLAVARLVIDPVAVQRVLEPLVADWQREWLATDTAMSCAIVRMRGCVAFICSAAYCCAIDDMPHDVRRPARVTLSAFIGLGLLLLIIPYASEGPDLIVYLLPANLTLSLAFAMLPLAMLLGTSVNRHGSRRHLVRTTIVVALFVFALHNWIAPHTNQAFREHASLRAAERAGEVARYRPPRRGLRELTLPEVVLVSLSTPGAVGSPSQVREELLRRITLPLVPVLLAIMGWGLARVSSSARPARLFGWWTFGCVTYGFAVSLGMTLERSWSTPREVAVWLPLALWCIAIIVLIRSRPSSALTI